MTDSELKKNVRERIIKIRTDGISTGKIVNASNGNLTIHDIYDMIGASVVPIEKWHAADNVLKKMGY